MEHRPLPKRTRRRSSETQALKRVLDGPLRRAIERGDVPDDVRASAEEVRRITESALKPRGDDADVDGDDAADVVDADGVDD